MLNARDINQFYYWTNKIQTSVFILEGMYGGNTITEESVIVYVGYCDQEKNILRSGWSCHNNVSGALGFLQYVVLPLGYYNWMDRESEGFYYPLSSFDVLTTQVMKGLDNTYDLILEDDALFKSYYEKINTCWGHSREQVLEALHSLTDSFNVDYNQDPNRVLFIKVFGSPLEVESFFMKSMEDEFEEVIEEEMGMSIEDFRFMCSKALYEPLINRNFLETLNEVLSICF